jgi:hypothetical protein
VQAGPLLYTYQADAYRQVSCFSLVVLGYVIIRETKRDEQ